MCTLIKINALLKIKKKNLCKFLVIGTANAESFCMFKKILHQRNFQCIIINVLYFSHSLVGTSSCWGNVVP